MQRNEQLTKRNDVVEKNLGLVRACARRFSGKGIDYDDLYAAGCEGLIKAADGFDPTRGYRFSSYAVPAILGEMRKLFRESGALRVGRKIRDLAYGIYRIKESYFQQHGEDPTVSMLAKMLDVTEEEVTQAILAVMPVSSLTGMDEEDGNEEQLDVPTESFEDILPLRITLDQVINSLDEKDRTLMQLRYREDKTQSETARIMGTSQVQISRREKKILLHIRQQLSV